MISNFQKDQVRIRIIDELNRIIESETQQSERAVLIAKRACAFARLSLIPEAKRQIDNLREYNTKYDARLTAWIMFCEALVHHFESLDTTAALNRLRRSLAIAAAIGEEELVSASRAWIANACFIQGDAAGAIEQLERLFATDRAIDSGTLARASLVVADLVSWSGRPSIAAQWYRLARRNAVEFGDISLQSLVMFNSASFHVADLTFRQCMEEEPSEGEIRVASLEVGSIVNLDRGIGQPFLRSMIPVLQADALLLEQKYSEALAIFNSILHNTADIRPQRLTPRILAQRAWVHARVSNLTKAADDCKLAEERAERCSDADDRAVMHARIAGAYSMCGALVNAQHNRQERNKYATEFRALQTQLQMQTQRLIEVGSRFIQIKNPA